ncbi:P2X purinoceptor 4-like isoform X2 [Paramacrobiotus metropolitanus]|uniref:P2X purinoceptor 4-like isoform X2 n=1 Tax=Paramacrobiotus metropolitanus TaxID=2943436 RepID=UPI0024461951|nr:P2X purinoceptor 4-like isoform X2 [Paramacrobiotus metropolitanus]
MLEGNTLNCGTIVRQSVVDTFTKYETARSVRFHSPCIAICNRLVQATIIAYVVIVVFIMDRGYQRSEEGESSVVARVVGLQQSQRENFTHLADRDPTQRKLKNKALGLTWDAVDTMVPALENNALFITTKVTATPKQTHGICAEDKFTGADCTGDSDCEIGRSIHLGHGLLNGHCNLTTHTCNVHAWCPLENETSSTTTLTGSEHLTLLVKNYIVFPKFRVRRRNFGDLDDSYVSNCVFNNATDPQCPAFNLGYIIRLAGEDYDEMARHGAILSFGIKWDCDLDFHIHHCTPKYFFRRLDPREGVIVPGWNYRRSGYWKEEGVFTRYLYKHTGIRIVFNVYAVARKFSYVQTTINLGSGLGLLGVTTILCDFMLYHCASPQKRLFRANATMVDVDKDTDDRS